MLVNQKMALTAKEGLFGCQQKKNDWNVFTLK